MTTQQKKQLIKKLNAANTPDEDIAFFAGYFRALNDCEN